MEPHHEHHHQEHPLEINGWSEEKEEFLKRIANRNGALIWMHNNSSIYYSRIDKVWSIIVACCFMVFGAGGIPDAVNTNCTTDGIGTSVVGNLAFALGILTIVFGVLSVVQVIVGLDNVSSSHSDAATRNTEVYLSILKEIKVDNCMLRIRGDRFVHMIVEQNSRNKTQAPSIPACQVKRYYKKFGKKAIPYEELFGEDELLQIDDSFRHMREREASVVSMMLHESKKNTVGLDEPISDEALDEQLKDHGKGQKFRRVVPTLDSSQLADLEKYLNSD